MEIECDPIKNPSILARFLIEKWLEIPFWASRRSYEDSMPAMDIVQLTLDVKIIGDNNNIAEEHGIKWKRVHLSEMTDSGH